MRETSCLQLGLFCSVYVVSVQVMLFVPCTCNAACELRNLLQTGKCKALHKFETNMDGELPLNQGDVIVTTAWINDEWLSGRLGDKEGIFPVSFVEILEELPQSNVGELMCCACGWGWG